MNNPHLLDDSSEEWTDVYAMQGLMSIDIMMSLDFVTNATTVKSRLSREAGNATNVKAPLRREEGMTTQVKSSHHGHPEGTHATDDRSYLNGRQGSNDMADVKSSQHGRLGSTELLSSICNICVTVFDLPDWLYMYGFRPAIGNATNVKFPLSREEGMMTQVKSFHHGHPEGTHATDDKSSLNGRQRSNDATDVKSPQQGRLGSTDVISAPTDTEDTYLPSTLKSVTPKSAQQSATMTYESRPSTEQPATATMTYESRPSTMTYESRPSTMPYEDHCPSDERSAKQSATLTSANQSISVHIADDDSDTDAAPIVPASAFISSVSYVLFRSVPSAVPVPASPSVSAALSSSVSVSASVPVSSSVPASVFISSVSYVLFRSVPSAVPASPSVSAALSSSVSVSASVPVSSSVPASAFVSSVSYVPFRLFDPGEDPPEPDIRDCIDCDQRSTRSMLYDILLPERSSSQRLISSKTMDVATEPPAKGDVRVSVWSAPSSRSLRTDFMMFHTKSGILHDRVMRSSLSNSGLCHWYFMGGTDTERTLTISLVAWFEF